MGSGSSFSRTRWNELWDLFAVPSDGGEVINLTQTPAIREESALWSPAGKTIAFNSKPKEATVYDVSVMDWATRKVTPLTHENTANHLWQAVAWSPDGKTLYANRIEVSFTDADIYAVDITSGNATSLTPHQGKVLKPSHFVIEGWEKPFDGIERREWLPERGSSRCRVKKAHLDYADQVGGQLGRLLGRWQALHVLRQC